MPFLHAPHQAGHVVRQPMRPGRIARGRALPARAGTITEGPGLDIVVVRDGALTAPESGVFEGITRRTALEIAAGLQLKTEIRAGRAEEVATADAIFISSTAGGIMPVTTYEGRPGALTTRIHDLDWRMHEDEAHNTPIAHRD